MLDTTEDPNGIHQAAAQLAAIIEKHITESFGDSAYARVLEEMRVLRSEMIDMEEPGIWNDWIKELKTKIVGGTLGEGRAELWWMIRKDRLGLIVKGESEVSKVGEEEANQVRDFKLQKTLGACSHRTVLLIKVIVDLTWIGININM